MKGLGTAGLIMIIVTGMVGLLFILMSSVGVTPLHYHALPEMQYIDMISSYYHLKENAERSIVSGSKDFFNIIKRYPLKWENWSSSGSFKSDFETLYSEKLGQMALSYLNSVSHPEEGLTVNFSTASSSLKYSSVKLSWNYTYNISLFIPLYGKGEKLHSIDTIEKISVNYDFLDLNDVYVCAKSFFNNKLPLITYGFDEKNSEEIKLSFKNVLYEELKSLSTCVGFVNNDEIDLEINVSCASECTCKSIKGANVILIFRNKDSKAGLALSDTFKNFYCGMSANGCMRGADCCTSGICNRDCVVGICSNCWLGSIGDRCSQKGSYDSLNDYKCYETKSGDYKCLRSYENVFYTYESSTYSLGTLNNINLNCGSSGSKYLRIIGGSKDYLLNYNGIDLNIGTPEIDLCDDNKIPRKSGKLSIFVSSDYDGNTYYYKIGDIKVRFALSNYIDSLNSMMESEHYKYTLCPSAEDLSTYYKKTIESYLNSKFSHSEFGFAGYDIDVSAEEINCDEKYAIIEVNFTESGGNVASTQHYLLDLKPIY